MKYKRWLICLPLGLCLAIWTGSVSAQQALEERVRKLEEQLKTVEKEKEPNTFRAYWKEGLKFETADKAFQAALGGRIQVDWAIFDADNDTQAFLGSSVPNGVEFRRARLEFESLLHDRFEFKTQIDFAGGAVALKDLYMGVVDLPVVEKFRVGQYKQPFSLEELTSSKYITFMERGLPNIFAVSRQIGFGVWSNAFDKRVTWAIGGFTVTDSDLGESVNLGVSGAELGAALRVTGLPWYEDKGKRLAHLGFSYSYQNQPADEIRIRQRPEAHLAPRFVDTGTFDARNQNRLGAEAALVYDRFSLQGEVMGTFVERKASGVNDPNFGGAYIFGSYFLTDDRRPYKTSSGTFDKVKPKNPLFNGNGGLGAWELAARYSYLDLDDEDITGGTLNDFTFGINWYLTTNYRVMFNYVRSHLNGVGDTNIFEMRAQVFF